MNKPRYRNKPIARVESLAKALKIDSNQLLYLANHANSFYHLHKRIEKPDGSFREVYSVRQELKIIHQTIVKGIFHQVYFPDYLQGAIKDHERPRSHIKAASLHASPSILVNIDISNFFPSLRSEMIFKLWKQFFNFSEPVAELLTKLTTLNGFLPQGAPTSPGLANLIFWDIEPKLVSKLQENRFKYTRYIDDIAISSKDFIEMHDLQAVLGDIFGMFANKGVKVNRKKLDISTSGHRMEVLKQIVNSGVPTLPRHERNRIRAAVHECKKSYLQDCGSEDYKKLWNSTIGRVNYLIVFHRNEAKGYLKCLETIHPKQTTL